MRAALAMTAASLAGCFYTETINERPSADIARQSLDSPTRGDRIRVSAEVYDPDGTMQQPTIAWTALACAEGEAEADCDEVTTGIQIQFEFDVPLTTDDDEPVNRVIVILDVTDPLGAHAVPRQHLELPIGNAEPTLEVQRQGRLFMGSYPIGVPVTIVARKADQDDGAANVMIDEPVLYAPTGASLEDATLTLVDETANEVTWELVATEPGQWDLELTARDPFEPTPGEVTAMISIPVAEDQSPCLAVAEPVFPPAGAQIVLEDARRFAVLAVEDDLDVWPEQPSDPYLGVAGFRWFLATPASGGAFVPLSGVDGSGVDLDPASYTPGDELALRVEVVDRLDRPLCDPALDSCAVAAGCYQRQTWRVEVR